MMVVYEILFVLQGLRYIGSTSNCARRWRRHRNDLAKGKHHSVYLQRLWNLHGAEAFEWHVLETVSSESGLVPAEMRWVAKLKPELNSVIPDSASRDRLRFSEASRCRMSVAHAGKVPWNKGGSTNRGEAHGSSVLTRDAVLAIRKVYAGGFTTQQVLASSYGVTRATISDIVVGKSWSWLSELLE